MTRITCFILFLVLYGYAIIVDVLIYTYFIGGYELGCLCSFFVAMIVFDPLVFFNTSNTEPICFIIISSDDLGIIIKYCANQ